MLVYILIRMLKNHIFKILTQNIDFQLTESQLSMLQQLSDFISGDPGDTFFC
jgi:hypothetical protein